jgi:RNA polymerase sigma-70 factor (ECF subfamily)
MTTGQQRPEEDDDQLVIAFQRDREGAPGRDAAARLFARWQWRVYVWAYRVMRDRDRALDVAQESMVQAYLALPRYEHRGTFSAWLFTIVHNRCRTELRQRIMTRDFEADPELMQGGLDGPEREFENRENEQRVLDAMREALEPSEQIALWLRAYEGLSVEDITRMLGVEGSTGARALLQTARRKLRAALDREGGIRRNEDERPTAGR